MKTENHDKLIIGCAPHGQRLFRRRPPGRNYRGCSARASNCRLNRSSAIHIP